MIKAINRSIAARREDNEKGFTLIELLVVILIIGVLAAIAIPAFLNQRQGAWVSQAESDLRNAAIAAESYAVANNGSYENLVAGSSPGTGGAIDLGLEDYGFNPTDSVTIAIGSATAAGFVITADHASLTEDYSYDSSTGVISEVP